MNITLALKHQQLDEHNANELWTIAENTCTHKQFEALRLWEAGLGYRRIAIQLHISQSAARDRIHRALIAIDQALEKKVA